MTRSDRAITPPGGISPRVLIIGGGINGIATFRELALHGVPTLLVERGDFVSGASAASSHMVHGGIRYLENGEFSLVKESVQERNRLLRNAPHYVHPLATTIPLQHVFAGLLAAPLRFLTHRQRTPKARGALLVKLGLMMYDTFAGRGAVVPTHRFRGPKATRRELPLLNPSMKYTATYYDAAMASPERLALDVLFDGLDQGPHARALNYVEAIGFGDDGAVILRDLLTGEETAVRADVVVNASGPWSDMTNRTLGIDSAFMGGTKGSHIVLDHPQLAAACAGREIFFENGDGRIVLVYPLAGRVLVGTTDLRVDIEATDIVCTEQEIDYFFELIARVFPDIAVDRSHIVFSFSGVRPLPRTQDAAPGFVSRDYRIEPSWIAGARSGTKLLTLVGGKWTTFRALGEKLSDAVLDAIGLPRTLSTEELPIGGGRDYPAGDDARAKWIQRHLTDFDPERAALLFERYGTRAAEVATFLRSELERDPRAEADLGVGARLTRAEIRYFIAREAANHVDDVFYRRTDLAFTGAVTQKLVDAVTQVFAETLGWTATEADAERGRVLDVLTASRSRVLRDPADLPVHPR